MYHDPDKYWPTRATSQQALAIRLLCEVPKEPRLRVVSPRDAGMTEAPIEVSFATEHGPVRHVFHNHHFPEARRA